MNRWKIYFNCYDLNGNFVGSGVYAKTTYKHKSSAVRTAKRIYGNATDFKYQWGVGVTNPFAI